MVKTEFIQAVKLPLKERGFRKKGQYWYKTQGAWIICYNVQGSQWDSNNYYVNLGAIPVESNDPTPPNYRWKLFMRCRNPKQTCPDPMDTIEDLDRVFGPLETLEQLPDFLEKHPVTTVGEQYFLY